MCCIALQLTQDVMQNMLQWLTLAYSHQPMANHQALVLDTAYAMPLSRLLVQPLVCVLHSAAFPTLLDEAYRAVSLHSLSKYTVAWPTVLSGLRGCATLAVSYT